MSRPRLLHIVVCAPHRADEVLLGRRYARRRHRFLPLEQRQELRSYRFCAAEKLVQHGSGLGWKRRRQPKRGAWLGSAGEPLPTLTSGDALARVDIDKLADGKGRAEDRAHRKSRPRHLANSQ